MQARSALIWALGATLVAGTVWGSGAGASEPEGVTSAGTVNLTDESDDPALWGQNYPHHYADYKKTGEQSPTKHGGSRVVRRTPTAEDPRAHTSQSRIEEDPRLVTMWAGYAFSKDFREDRGHAYMLEDQKYTRRQKAVQQPGTCLNCHASVYVPFKKAGNGDLVKGFEMLNAMKYQDAVQHVKYPVSCIDCHDPATMKLRVTRPAFMEGMRAYKASQGVKDYDVNKAASQKEMRTFVCGQCHVEYYFKGPEKRLVFPWSKGLKVDEIYSFYEDTQFKDWTHARTGAPALKAQHPEFELYSQGIHARSGVSCADCHMPRKKVGEDLRITDHQIRSPLAAEAASCKTCHRWSPAEMQARVEIHQDRTAALRDRAMNALMALISEIETASASGKPDAALAQARALQRKSQFYLDFVEAENSVGFHAPGEAARILAESIDLSRQGQLALRP